MSFCEAFFMQIRCVGLRSKYFRFPSAMEEVAGFQRWISGYFT